MIRMPKILPRPTTLLLIVGVLVWFGTSVEPKDSPSVQRVVANPRVLLSNPLIGLQAMIARNGDDRLYYNYAQLMLGGAPDFDYLSHKEQGDPATAQARLRQLITPDGPLRVPYRDFPVEYPPVPLLLMLLPRLFVASYPGYRILFTAFTAILFLLTAGLAGRLVTASAPVPETPSVETVWRRLGWLLLACGPLLCQRFDLLPAALVAAGLVAVTQGRDKLAGVVLGLAIMTKLYPLLLALPLAAFLVGTGQRRRVAVVAISCCVTVLAVVAPFLLLAPTEFLRSNALYGARPFHFESTFGSCLLALQGPSVAVSSFGSRNVVSSAWLLKLSGLLLGGGLIAITAFAWRSGRTLAAASLARRSTALLVWALGTLLWVLCTSKVLSPQFLIWLLPLAAVIPGSAGRRVFWASFAAFGLTQIYYPALYDLVIDGNPPATAILLGRNLLLVAMTVFVLRMARTEAQLGTASARFRPAAAAPLAPHQQP
jgi:hypothetical protein